MNKAAAISSFVLCMFFAVVIMFFPTYRALLALFLLLMCVVTIMNIENGLIVLFFIVASGAFVHMSLGGASKMFLFSDLAAVPVILGIYARLLLLGKMPRITGLPLWRWAVGAAILLLILTWKNPSIEGGWFSVTISEFLLLFIGLSCAKISYKKVLNWVMIFAVLLSLLGIVQHFSGINSPLNAAHSDFVANAYFIRAYATFGAPNIFAIFLGPLLAVFFIFFVCNSSRKNKYLLAIALFIASMAFFATISRAAILSATIVLTASSCILWKKLKFAQRRSVIIAILLILFASSFFVINGTFTKRFDFGADNYDVSRRDFIYQHALKVISDNIWLGIGPGSYEQIAKDYHLTLLEAKNVHNSYLQVWMERGIFAFLAFLTIFIAFFLQSFYRLKERNLVILAAFLSISISCLHGLFDFFLTSGIGLIVAFLLSVPFGVPRR